VGPQTDASDESIFSLPTKLISYLETLPEMTSFYAGNDLATCTTTVTTSTLTNIPAGNPNHATHALPPPESVGIILPTDGVTKTSVLVLTTSTGNPVIKTVNPPAPQPALSGGGGTTTTPTPVASNSGAGATAGSNNLGAAVINLLGSGTKAGANAQGSAGNPTNLGNAVASAVAAGGTGAGGSGTKPVPAGITPAPASSPALTFSGQIITANSAGAFVISGSTLTPGGPAVTISGSTISIGKAGSGSTVAVINGVTSTLAGVTPAGAGFLTIDGTTFAPSVSAGSTFFVVAGTTLTPGGPAATISGSTISIGKIGSGSTIAVINGVTSTLAGSTPAGAGFLTIDGTTFAPSVSAGSTFYVIDGTTLGVGQVATVHGTTLSLASNDETLVINGQTSYFPKATGVQMFTGAGVRPVVGKLMWTCVGLFVVGCSFFLM
jgi:hypothetical protein